MHRQDWFYFYRWTIWSSNYTRVERNLEYRWLNARVLCAQSCLILCDPLNGSLFPAPWSKGFSRQEYWSGFAISFSRESSQPRDKTRISYIARQTLYHWATGKPSFRSLSFSAATRKATFGFASPCFCRCSPLLNT